MKTFPLLNLLVCHIGGERLGCRSLNYGDSDQGMLGQIVYPIWSVFHIGVMLVVFLGLI